MSDETTGAPATSDVAAQDSTATAAAPDHGDETIPVKRSELLALIADREKSAADYAWAEARRTFQGKPTKAAAPTTLADFLKSPAPLPVAPPAPAAQSSSRLEKLIEMFITAQLADRLPKVEPAPPDGNVHRANAARVHHAISSKVARLDRSDPRYNEKVRDATLGELRNVRVVPDGAPPHLGPRRSK